MAYEKQKFTDGQVLKADHLNHIEQGIVEAETQSNWNQNDTTKVDYIKNRTHWIEYIGKDREIFPLSDVAFRTSMMVLEGSVADGLIGGHTYIVSWAGVDYEVVCQLDNMSDPYLGNGALIYASDEATEHPFCIASGGGNYYYATKETSTAETISVKIVEKMVTVYHKLGKEFLPDDIGGGSGGVSSWNDLTDKPFYTETGETILPETTVEFDAETGEGVMADVVAIVVGNTYTVYWNGTEYPCVAGSFDMDGMPLATLGNLGAMTGEGGTDEPFLLLALPAEVAASEGFGTVVMGLDGSTSATVSIKEVIVHPLPIMYMPELMVTFTPDISTNTVTADKTLEQIKAAFDKGYKVMGKTPFSLASQNGDEIVTAATIWHLIKIHLLNGVVDKAIFVSFEGGVIVQYTYATDGITISAYTI